MNIGRLSGAVRAVVRGCFCLLLCSDRVGSVCLACEVVVVSPSGRSRAWSKKTWIQSGRAVLFWVQELAKFEMDCRNIVINQVIFPEEGGSTLILQTADLEIESLKLKC